jgi:PKD repeat protein
MKRKFLLSFFAVAIITSGFAQALLIKNEVNIPEVKNIPIESFVSPDMAAINLEDQTRDRQGMLYRIGVAQLTNISPQHIGNWDTKIDGSREWTLRINSPGAEALSFLFEKFVLYGATTLDITDVNGKRLHKTLTSKDVESHQMYNANLCFGDDMILLLREPAYTMPSLIHIDKVMHNYRATGNPAVQKINESDPCQVNVNCSPVGDSWQDEKRGVARIYCVTGNMGGWCSGSLVNNTAQDCKPLMLTALHCGENSSAGNMNQWKFYFGYEAPNCNNPNTAGTLDDNYINGCVRLSDSNDGGGNSGSDFLLVQMGTLNNESQTVTNLKSNNFNAYWNGWDANNTTSNSGCSMHHPSGDIKKISTFTSNLNTSGWNGNGVQSHWRVYWTSNSNGHGVTEGGSSGSPIFRSNGRIMGTLTGGGSYCNQTNAPDYYGKVSYHWTSNGNAANEKLKTNLDPINSGALVLDGSNDPCSNPTPPVANFTGTPTTVSPGGVVQFSDQSSGVPTSHSWSISPASGWAYSGGSTASSASPSVTFNTVGQYSITLTVTNTLGNDTEVKTNYITVAQSTGPCAATSSQCDEYIMQLELNTIDNSSNCSTGGYADYSSQSTSLSKGSAYQVTVTPGINGAAGAYTDDEIAVWIDYNNDFDFDDAGEQVAYVLVASGWNNVFDFTVPTSATTGNVSMRVRISYQPDGAIDACGNSTYGETEDYTVNITGSGTSSLGSLSLSGAKIYPNPTNDMVFIDVTGIKDELQSVSIMDVSGRSIQNVKVENNGLIEVDLSSLSSGVYSLL